MSPFALGAAAFAAIIVATAGILSVLLSAGVFKLASATQFLATLTGKSILYAFGSFLLAIGIHYASVFFRGRTQIAHFSQDGQWGKIELSPYALREFVSGIMRNEIGIDHFKAKLGHLDNGLSIKITTTLSPEDKVAEVGQRIQETLSHRVAERTGVEVSKVSVLVNSIQSHSQESDSSHNSKEDQDEPISAS